MIEDLARYYNELLKADGCAARIYLKEGRLKLQATLPPMPESKKDYPHQQRINLKLPATPANLEVADRKARILGKAIAEGTFDWSEWRSTPRPKGRTCLEWVEIYKKDFFDQRADTPESRSTWSDHFKILKKLPEDKGLTPQVLKDVLLSTSPDSRNRQKATRILSKLAELAEIPVALSSYSGNYGLKSLDPRHLPSDEEILEWREKISSPEWQLVYSLLAAYGLRPHELAYLLLDTPPALNILDGKTGPRIAYPCPSTWVNDWALNSLALLPPLAGKDNSAIGNKVTKAFGRLEIPFKPYDLRHCWAIRSIQYFEPVIAAAIMGHSLQTHNQRYHRWLNAEHLKTAFERSKAGD